jgi:glyoxylase-like metal-dependent hydrolase (beta-lactamase superfamily II)
MELGNLRITRLNDGFSEWDETKVAPRENPEQVRSEMARLEVDHEPHSCLRVTCLLIEMPDRKILIDTGWGRWPFSQRVPVGLPVVHQLKTAGYDPEDIDLVINSHAHPDHLGGNVDDSSGELQARYRTAKYFLHQNDFDYYTSPEWLEKSQIHAKNLPPLKEAKTLELIDKEAEVEVAPGITMLPAFGHSPGNCVIVIRSGNEEAIYLGDVAHHPVHLEHPDWNAVFDVDPAMARETRKWLYEKLVDEQPWVIGCHFLSPGIGKLEREGPAYKWRELSK